jgi:hypothetical protein
MLEHLNQDALWAFVEQVRVFLASIDLPPVSVPDIELPERIAEAQARLGTPAAMSAIMAAGALTMGAATGHLIARIKSRSAGFWTLAGALLVPNVLLMLLPSRRWRRRTHPITTKTKRYLPQPRLQRSPGPKFGHAVRHRTMTPPPQTVTYRTTG